MRITKTTAQTLVNILKDHKDCLTRDDFPVCGKAAIEALRHHGIEVNTTAEEIDSKAPLIWQIDVLVELLEAGSDEKEDGE